jgi:hypothetical protein
VVVSAEPALVSAGQSTTITVELRDRDDQPVAVSGEVPRLETSLGTLSALTQVGTGKYSARLGSTRTGTAVVRGRRGNLVFPRVAMVVFQPGPRAPRPPGWRWIAR